MCNVYNTLLDSFFKSAPHKLSYHFRVTYPNCPHIIAHLNQKQSEDNLICNQTLHKQPPPAESRQELLALETDYLAHPADSNDPEHK